MRLILLDISCHISCVPWKTIPGCKTLLGVLVDQNSLILILYHYPPPHTHIVPFLSLSLSFSLNDFKKLWCQGAYKM